MANPIINNMVKVDSIILENEPMSIGGTINKTLIMLALIVISACYTWGLAFSGFTDKASILTMGGLIVGAILAFIIIFSRKAMNVLVPVYSLAEGLFLGGISAVYAGQYAGIVTQAVILTFATLGVMLSLFKLDIIKCTAKFRAVVITATASIAAIYLIQMVASFFGRGIPVIFTASPIGIAFSAFVVLVAALNLIIDFELIERGSHGLLPKEYEWYGAFGLILSLIWLYLEFLRLLAKLNSRN